MLVQRQSSKIGLPGMCLNIGSRVGVIIWRCLCHHCRCRYCPSLSSCWSCHHSSCGRCRSRRSHRCDVYFFIQLLRIIAIDSMCWVETRSEFTCSSPSGLDVQFNWDDVSGCSPITLGVFIEEQAGLLCSGFFLGERCGLPSSNGGVPCSNAATGVPPKYRTNCSSGCCM